MSRKMVFEVTATVPDDVDSNYLREYMRSAICSWSGQFNPEDSLFGWWYRKDRKGDLHYSKLTIKPIKTVEL